MHIANEIVIHAPIDRIFSLGAAIGDWTTHLPHYRYVRVTEDDGVVKQAVMGAWRGWIPVQWRTSQVVLPESKRLLFFHTGGITRGMYVEWNLTPLLPVEGGGVRVTITHELTYPLPALTNWFAEGVVGRIFVSYIATMTLARFKAIAERTV